MRSNIPSDLYCDINVNSNMALRNTLLIKTYVEIDPRARLLIMAVKYWAKRRELNDGTASIPFIYLSYFN